MNEIEIFDICIIGGSIAGNYLGYLLQNSGLRIAIIEEHETIGKPLQCAGIVSMKLKSLIPIPEKIILNRVNKAKLVSPSGNYIILEGNEVPLVIDRIALDKYFYEKIKNSPLITYYLGEKFKHFKYIKKNHEKKILIQTSKRLIEAKMLVGCDGPRSMVSKILKVFYDVLPAVQIRIKGNFKEDEAAMYFNHAWNELFGWIVPEGKSIFRIGLASLKNVNRKFRRFLNMIKLDYDEKIDQQGGLIPFCRMDKIAFENVLLLGDAACQVKATTGGGIVMLVTAAKQAARCIAHCFKKQDFSKKTIKKFYEKPLKRLIGKDLRIHWIIREILRAFNSKDYDNFFEILKNNKIEKIISIYGDMDFPKSLFLKLMVNVSVLKFIFRFLLTHPQIILKIFKNMPFL
ncbi:MAG: hypothetical protein ACTSRH_06850 [Promethearchaeota archaeon]